MISMYLYFFVVSLLLYISWRFTKYRTFVNPAFLFTFGFFCQAFYALFWIEEWDLDLHPLTFLTLTGGIALFVCTSIVCEMIWLIREDNCAELYSVDEDRYHVENWKLLVGLALQLLLWYICFRYILLLPGDTLSQQIAYGHTAESFGDPLLHRDFFTNRLYKFVTAFEYVACFLIGREALISSSTKHRILLALIFIVAVFRGVTGGARGGAMMTIIMTMIMFLMFYFKKKKWSLKGIKSMLCKFAVAGLGVVCSFQGLMFFDGRSDGSYNKAFEYMAVYLSAELKNLDNFVRAGRFGEEFFTYKSGMFFSLKGFLMKWFDITDWPTPSDEQFFYGDRWLGNVSTTFCTFLHDGGFLFLVVCVFVMASLSVWLYCRSVNCIKKNPLDLNLYLIVYSFVGSTLVFSFFSNKFFENIVVPGHIELIIYILLIFWFGKHNIKILV